MRHIKLIAVLGLVLLLGLAAGCSPSGINSSSAGVPVVPGGGGAGTPASVLVTFGTFTSTAIANSGSTVVTATVRDSLGAAVPNATVSFTVISAVTGSFSPASATTNAAGITTTTFTAASPAGDDQAATVLASVIVGSGTINGNASIVIGNPPRVPTSVLVSLGSATNYVNNAGSTTVTATVSDALGLISGATVTFTASVPGAGNFTAAAPTNAFGQTTVTFTANSPAGDDSIVNITASAGAVSNSAKLTIGIPAPPTPTSASITINPLSINIQSQTVVSVTVLGASGPAFSTPVTLNITSGSGLASFSTGTTQSAIIVNTNASGIASAPIYSGASSGTVTVTATVGALAPVQASLFITSNPATISLSVANSNLTNSQTTNITATVLNVLNNPVSDGTQVNFAITSLGTPAGTLSASSASTIGGKAQVTFSADAVKTGGVIIQASVAPLAAVQTIIIVNSAQAGSLQYVSVSPLSGVVDLKGGSALVTFKVLDINGVALQGQTVNFQLAVFPFGASVNPPSNSTDKNGLVTTTLTPGPVAGPVRIVANTTVQGTSTVLFASSGPLSIGGGVPSMRFFSISVSKFNVPGLLCDGVPDNINVLMADRFGNYNILKGTAVSFTTSFGAIDTSNITDDVGATTSVWRSQNPRPADGEVAILVQTTGEENFTDLDADGVYTGADAFNTALVPAGDDLPEPFIDANHNGAHDIGEVFFDWPSSVPGAVAGAYNTGNGQWDGNIPIFKNIDIWMTGPPDVSLATSHIACCDPGVNPKCVSGAAVTSNISIPKGTSTTCYVFGADVNNNALVGGTTVSLAADKADAGIKLTSGFSTYPDHAVFGPEITGFTVTNNNQSATTDEIATLSATITWTSPCGGLTPTFSYAGNVTLSHL
jgi:hypothetical protein